MAKVKQDKFFEFFVGEYLVVAMDQRVETMKATKLQKQTMKAPISTSGYLTEEDDTYYYLGAVPGTISQAVPKARVFHIEVSSEEAEASESLPKKETNDNSDTSYN